MGVLIKDWPIEYIALAHTDSCLYIERHRSVVLISCNSGCLPSKAVSINMSLNDHIFVIYTLLGHIKNNMEVRLFEQIDSCFSVNVIMALCVHAVMICYYMHD